MFVAISCFEMQNGLEDEVKQAFKNRPEKGETDSGFIRLDVLSAAENASAI